MRVLTLPSKGVPLLANLFSGTLSPTPDNLSLVWQTLGSFNYFPGTDSIAINFWTTSLLLAVRLAHTNELPLDEFTIPALLHVANTAVYLAKLDRNLKGINALLGHPDPDQVPVQELSLTPCFPCCFEFQFFNHFQSLHTFSIPPFSEIIRRALLVASIQIRWTCVQIEDANIDYRKSTLTDETAFSFIFVRFFYERIWGTEVLRERLALPEDPVGLTELARLKFAQSPEVTRETPNSLLFAGLLSGIYDSDSDNPTLSILRAGYRERPLNAVKNMITPVVFKASILSIPEGGAELLSFLAQLDVDQIPKESLGVIAAFWAFKTASIIGWIKHEFNFDSKFLVGIFGLARNAISFSKAISDDFPIVAFSEGRYASEIVDVPVIYPLRPALADIERVIGSIRCSLKYCPDLSLPSVDDIFRRSLLFAAILSHFGNPLVYAINPEFCCTSLETFEFPTLTSQNAISISMIRFLYEIFSDKQIPRAFPATMSLSLNTPYSAFIFEDLRPIVFQPAFSPEFVLLAVLNFALSPPESSAREPETPGLAVFEHFIDHSDHLLSILQESVRAVAALLDPIPFLVARSAYGSPVEAIPLIDSAECLPLLSDRFLNHRLLKLFAAEKDSQVLESPVFELTLEAVAEVVWLRRFPDSPEFCLASISYLYDLLLERTISSDADRFAHVLVGLRYLHGRVLKNPSDFFNSKISDLDLLNALFFKALTHAKSINLQLPINLSSDLTTHGYLAIEVRKLIDRENPARVLFLYAFVVEQDAFRELSFSVFAIDHHQALYGYLLRLGKFSFLRTIQNHVRHAELWDQIGLPLALALFWLSGSALGDFAAYFVQKNLQTAISVMWTFLTEGHHGAALEIFNAVKLDAIVARSIIETIPPTLLTIDSPIPELITIATRLIDFFPRSAFHCGLPVPKSTTYNIGWDDDDRQKEPIERSSAVDVNNIWAEQQLPPVCQRKCDRSQVAFVCYSCRTQRELICLNCAVNCHRNHSLSYVRCNEFNCRCSSICGCTESVVKSEAPPTVPLLRLLLAVCHTPPSDTQKPTGRLIIPLGNTCDRDVKTLNLKEANCRNVEPRVQLQLVHPPIIKPHEFSRPSLGQDGQQLIHKRSSHSPLKFGGYAGGLIFLAAGSTIKCFTVDKIEFVTEFATIGPTITLEVLARPGLETYVAAASLRTFEVFAVNGDGHNRRLFQSHIVDRIHTLQWIFQEHLAVVTPSVVQIYAIVESSPPRAPLEQYLAGHDEITSAVFLEKDNIPYVLIAFHGGNSAFEQILQGRGATIHPNRSMMWPSRFVAINVSLCSEANLFFIAAPGTGLQLFRTEDLFTPTPPRVTQVSSFDGASGELKFCCTYPGCDSVLLFVRPASNTLYYLEIIPKNISVARLSVHSSWPFFDQEQEFYAWIRTDREFLVIGGDGAVYSLLPSISDSDEDFLDEYRVPPTFWSTARRAGQDISEITGTDSTQNFNSLYSDSVASFHPPVSNKILTFHIRDPTLAIVGMMLSFGSHGENHRPAQVVLNGRSYRTKRDRIYMFPLKPSEVHAGQSVSLFFPGGIQYDIIMQSAVIFVMPIDKIRPFILSDEEAPDWMLRPRGLLDFQDRTGGHRVERAALQIVMAIGNRGEEEKVPDEVMWKLVRLMYKSKEFAGVARGALVRVATIDPELINVWAGALRNVLNEGGNELLWDAVWRDIPLMGERWQQELQDAAWEAEPVFRSIGAVIAAFGYPNE